VKFWLKMEVEKEKSQFWNTQKQYDFELISYRLK
jgi:hypothetical protein